LINKKIGQALHDHNMISDGDRILVAVSGGVDSLVTALILSMWRAKAPVHYDMEAVYIDNGFWDPASGVSSPVEKIGTQLARFSIPFIVKQSWHLPEGEERTCFSCARNRRSQLFELARKKGCSKLALGHHKDDLIETFFLNTLYSGNISTMLPRQDLFDGNLSIIRVLAYLEKSDVVSIAEQVGLEPVESLCPFAGDTRRDLVREILEVVYQRIPQAKGSLFSALGNVREGYML